MIDEKPLERVRDAALLRRLHYEWKECVLCSSVGFEIGFNWIGLSLHHINKHPRDDLEGNLVMVCGDGTRGCHGRLEARDPVTVRLLGEYVRDHRPDVIDYIFWRFGDAGDAWLHRMLRLESF